MPGPSSPYLKLDELLSARAFLERSGHGLVCPTCLGPLAVSDDTTLGGDAAHCSLCDRAMKACELASLVWSMSLEKALVKLCALLEIRPGPSPRCKEGDRSPEWCFHQG